MEKIDSGNQCFPSSIQEEEIKYLLCLHLSVLSFIIMPLGNIIIPMILWFAKRDKYIALKKQVSDLLNYQILWTLLFFASILIFGLLNTKAEINNWIPLYISGFLFLINIIYPIAVSVFLKKGFLRRFYYPPMKFFIL